jgi:hypothetical protein
MKLAVASLALLFSATTAFQVGRPVATSRSSTSLSVKTGETTSAAEKVQQLFKDKPAENEAFDKLVKKNFPGANTCCRFVGREEI